MKHLGPLAVVVVLFVSCGKTSVEAPRVTIAAPTLATFVVENSPFESETRLDGVIEAVNQATVAAQTSGRVVELPYDVGDYVKQGAIVVRLTAIEQKAQAGGAAAALTEAQARLTDAKTQHDRIANLFRQGVVAKAAQDRANADLDSAAARVEGARNALVQAREQFNYTVVRAPYSGIILKRQVEIGETVSVGRPLITELSLENLRAVVEVSQQHIGPLRAYKKARVILPDEHSVAAIKLQIPPSADANTHTFRVLVTVPPGDHGAFPGTLVKVAFVSGEQSQILLPAAALQRRGEVTAVYVVDAERLSLRYVRVGSPDAHGSVPMLAGLHLGERIAADAVAGGVMYKKSAPQKAVTP